MTGKCTVSVTGRGGWGSSCMDVDQKQHCSKSSTANRLCVITLVIGAAQHWGKEHLSSRLLGNTPELSYSLWARVNRWTNDNISCQTLRINDGPSLWKNYIQTFLTVQAALSLRSLMSCQSGKNWDVDSLMGSAEAFCSRSRHDNKVIWFLEGLD